MTKLFFKELGKEMWEGISGIGGLIFGVLILTGLLYLTFYILKPVGNFFADLPDWTQRTIEILSGWSVF